MPQNSTLFEKHFKGDMQNNQDIPMVQLIFANYFLLKREIDKAKKSIVRCIELGNTQRHNIPFVREEDDYDTTTPAFEYYGLIVGLESVFTLASYIYAATESDNDFNRVVLFQQGLNFFMINRLRGRKSCNRNYISFRTINSHSISDLIRNAITVVHPSEMNDPVDSLIIPWAEIQKDRISALEKAANTEEAKFRFHTCEREYKAFTVSLENYRIRSFSVGNDIVRNTLMWAHYGNNHKGLAINYVFSEKFKYNFNNNSEQILTPVTYSKHDDRIDISKDNMPLTEIGFLTKSKDWEYENEVRLISYDKTTSSHFQQISLDQDSKVDSIYFGIKCSVQDINTVKEIFKDKNVKFYQMKVNPQNIYRLDFSEC